MTRLPGCWGVSCKRQKLAAGWAAPSKSCCCKPWRSSRSERTRDETGPYLAAKWRQIAEHPLVGEARSIGLIGALELVRDKGSRRFFDPRGEVGTICRDFCFQNGLIMRAVRDTLIISPPLVINREQVDELAEKAWRCLDLTLQRCRAEGRI